MSGFLENAAGFVVRAVFGDFSTKLIAALLVLSLVFCCGFPYVLLMPPVICSLVIPKLKNVGELSKEAGATVGVAWMFSFLCSYLVAISLSVAAIEFLYMVKPLVIASFFFFLIGLAVVGVVQTPIIARYFKGIDVPEKGPFYFLGMGLVASEFPLLGFYYYVIINWH